mgnify:CR=1 FL=1
MPIQPAPSPHPKQVIPVTDVTPPYRSEQPALEDLAALDGIVLVEFGANWCGHCRAAQPAIVAALEQYPQVRRIKVEDGKGRPLGRHFGVKLWPTLVFLNQGKEVARVVRPTDAAEVATVLANLAGA